MSDISAGLRLSDRTNSGKGYFPYFRMTAASSLLAALLFKFSQVIAPGYNLQNTAFMGFLAYFYFALARAAFVSAHAQCYPRKGPRETGVAFGLWLATVRSRAILASAIGVLAGAVLDAFVAPLVGRGWTHFALYLAALALWATMAPAFLIHVARGAARGSLPALRGLEPVIQKIELVPAWLIAVLLMAVIDAAGGRFVYFELRAIVAEYLPDGRAIYFYSVTYYACLFSLFFWIQCWFVRLAILPTLTRGGHARSTTHRKPSPDVRERSVAAPTPSKPTQATLRLCMLGALLAGLALVIAMRLLGLRM